MSVRMVRTSQDPGRAGMHKYGAASVWVSGPVSGTWWATVKLRGKEQDLEAKSYEAVLREAAEWVDSSSLSPNGRATVADHTAARELDLYIANTYELVGAPNSIGKSIDANLHRKLAKGTYDSALAPKAWQHLVDEGAKRYQREFGSGSPIFNAATRRQVAADFARAWEEENKISGGHSKNPAPMRPEELARYATRESVRNTERFGLTKDGSERAYVIGRQDIHGPGALGAVLDALGVMADDEGRTEHGYYEFWGRMPGGGAAWRVVVVPEK